MSLCQNKWVGEEDAVTSGDWTLWWLWSTKTRTVNTIDRPLHCTYIYRVDSPVNYCGDLVLASTVDIRLWHICLQILVK